MTAERCKAITAAGTRCLAREGWAFCSQHDPNRLARESGRRGGMANVRRMESDPAEWQRTMDGLARGRKVMAARRAAMQAKVRLLVKAGEPVWRIAEELGISPSVVRRIKRAAL